MSGRANVIAKCCNAAIQVVINLIAGAPHGTSNWKCEGEAWTVPG